MADNKHGEAAFALLFPDIIYRCLISYKSRWGSAPSGNDIPREAVRVEMDHLNTLYPPVGRAWRKWKDQTHALNSVYAAVRKIVNGETLSQSLATFREEIALLEHSGHHEYRICELLRMLICTKATNAEILYYTRLVLGKDAVPAGMTVEGRALIQSLNAGINAAKVYRSAVDMDAHGMCG